MAKHTTSVAEVESQIFEIRGYRVMLDADLAQLYGVRTNALLQSVKRNAERIPSDFLGTNLRSQNVTSSCRPPERWGGRRTLPYAFSEQGVAMLSSVLRSPRAIAVNIAIMRAFVRLRDLADIANIVRAIRQLAAPPEGKPKRPIGFVA
jgi:hypothetical protein